MYQILGNVSAFLGETERERTVLHEERRVERVLAESAAPVIPSAATHPRRRGIGLAGVRDRLLRRGRSVTAAINPN